MRRSSGFALTFHQSNHEGQLVDWIQSARETAEAIIINPAGYSFTSVAILDAIKAFEGPVLEVHISNIHARDEYHRHSKISSAATGVICGLGPYGYIAAMHAIAQMREKPDLTGECCRAPACARSRPKAENQRPRTKGEARAIDLAMEAFGPPR